MRGKFNWSQTKRHKPSKPEYIFQKWLICQALANLHLGWIFLLVKPQTEHSFSGFLQDSSLLGAERRNSAPQN